MCPPVDLCASMAPKWRCTNLEPSCRHASPSQSRSALPNHTQKAQTPRPTDAPRTKQALRAGYDGGSSRIARAPLKPPPGAAPLWRGWRARARASTTTTTTTRRAAAPNDAKSESKDQDEQDDALLRHVLDWYYEDEDLEAELQKFAFDHAQEFEDECSSTGEYSLEHTELHREFGVSLRGDWRSAWSGTGSPVQISIGWSLRIKRGLPNYIRGHTFAAVINSTMSFESFYELMRDGKRGDFAGACRCCRTRTRWSSHFEVPSVGSAVGLWGYIAR